MIRFILKRELCDSHSGLKTEQLFTLDDDLGDLEAALRCGGNGPSGYEYVSLVGVEVIEAAN